MLLYHPDKQVGNEEWVSERAKKVNEAYTALKDETKRAEYDHKLTEQMLSQKFPAGPSHGTTYHRRPAGTFSRRRSSEASSGWNSIRPYMTKILVVLYIFIALIVFGSIYLRNRSADLEAELVPEPTKTGSSERAQTFAAVAPNTAAVEQNTPQIVPAIPAEPKKDPVQMPQETRTASTSSPLQTIKSWFQPNEKKQAQVPAKVKTDNTTLAGKNVNSVQDNAGLPIITPVRPSNGEQIRREDPPPHQAEVQKVSAEPARPQQELKQTAVAPPVVEPITKEEVEEFMQRYVRAYTKSDLNTFLSLFSRSAVENNTLTYNEIRNAYKETFGEKINHYKIINMDIRTDGQTATVSGIYNINRYISSDDRWVRYSGKIVWRLKRENDQLRIISTNYDK